MSIPTCSALLACRRELDILVSAFPISADRIVCAVTQTHQIGASNGGAIERRRERERGRKIIIASRRSRDGVARMTQRSLTTAHLLLPIEGRPVPSGLQCLLLLVDGAKVLRDECNGSD